MLIPLEYRHAKGLPTQFYKAQSLPAHWNHLLSHSAALSEYSQVLFLQLVTGKTPDSGAETDSVQPYPEASVSQS